MTPGKVSKRKGKGVRRGSGRKQVARRGSGARAPEAPRRPDRHAPARHASRKVTGRKRRRRTGPGGVAFPRPFTIRGSPVQGKGAFAYRWIAAGTRIIEYTGDRIHPDVADQRYDDDAMDRHHTFLFAVDDETVIDAGVGGNEARFINHSCAPNCEALDEGGRIFIEALRDIAPGEELFYDYAYEVDEPLTPALRRQYPCHCGAKSCRGTILAVKGRGR